MSILLCDYNFDLRVFALRNTIQGTPLTSTSKRIGYF